MKRIVRSKKTKRIVRSKKTKRYRKSNTKRKYMKKGGAPLRESFNSYTELQKYLDNNTSWINSHTRIWIVKKGENNALYESNTKDILESLYDHGITSQNINEYWFNIL